MTARLVSLGDLKRFTGMNCQRCSLLSQRCGEKPQRNFWCLEPGGNNVPQKKKGIKPAILRILNMKESHRCRRNAEAFRNLECCGFQGSCKSAIREYVRLFARAGKSSNEARHPLQRPLKLPAPFKQRGGPASLIAASHLRSP